MNNLTYFWQKKTILSFIAALFVVIIHNSATGQYDTSSPDAFVNLTFFFRNLFAYDIGAVAVPLFFFLSGFTIFRNYRLKSYPKKMKSRVKTLLFPYLFWNLFGLLFTILITITPLRGSISGREIFIPSASNILEGIFLYKYNFQFWFLYDLIIYSLLTPLIYLLIHNKYVGAISLIIVFFLPALSGSFLNLNLHFTIFYFLGCYLGRHFLPFFSKKPSTKLSFVSGLIFITTVVLKILSIYNIIPLPVILSQLLLITMLLSFWFFSDLFVKRIKLKKYMDEFFPIYTLHTYFIAVIVKTIYLVGPKTSYMLFTNEIVGSLLAIIAVTVFSYLWHKKLPKTYNLLFGVNSKAKSSLD